MIKSHRLPGRAAFLRFLDLSGSLPARVWLHGFPLAATAYFPTFAAHPDLTGHRSLLPDFLGFGYSDRPDEFAYTMQDHADTIGQLLDALDLSECAFIGQSWGGSVAVLLAHSRPDLVSRLVLIDAYLEEGGGGWLTKSIADQSEDAYLSGGHADLVEGTRRRAIESGSEITAAFLATLEAAAPHAVHRSARSLQAGVLPSVRERLAALSVPRFYLLGATEERPDADDLPRSGVEVLRVPGAGRFMFAENPKAFVANLRTALDSD